MGYERHAELLKLALYDVLKLLELRPRLAATLPHKVDQLQRAWAHTPPLSGGGAKAVAFGAAAQAQWMGRLTAASASSFSASISISE